MPRSPIKKHDRDDRTHDIFDRKLEESKQDEWEVTDGDDDYYDYQDSLMCECEQDWTCGPCKAAGRFGGYTWIETRYDSMFDAEDRYGF